LKIKTKILQLVFLALLLILNGCTQQAQVPGGFVYVDQVIPTAQYDIRYYSNNNFVGSRIDGYDAPTAIITNEAAQALKAVSEELEAEGYYLKIFDAYRPQKAVNHFIRWSQDNNDTKMKAQYYPHMSKQALFNFGYIAKKSAHTRGSTVDLTLVYKETGKELDMGSSYDFLDKISAHGTTLITTAQAANRVILKDAMQKHSFRSYVKEWWHYTLIKEPYPNQYFNFDVN
jgi:D-alanyl-D-alanine dipeptidase